MKPKIYFLFDIKPPREKKKQLKICRLYINNGKRNKNTCKSCGRIKECLTLLRTQKSTAT